ncbi:hypothetical protein JB92DRAFT_3140665 [Gautieria morchelliformis]|nr:hypothetical protein JB92DRAFT_3140665 [Gautieria morchelliformis]
MAKLRVFCLALDGGLDEVEHTISINVEPEWFLDHLQRELRGRYAPYKEAILSEIKVWVLERYLDKGHLSPFNMETATTYNDVPIKKIEADARRPILSYFPNKIEAKDVGKIHLIAKLGQITPSNLAKYGLSEILSGSDGHVSKHCLSDTVGETYGNTDHPSKRPRHGINIQLTAFHTEHWDKPLGPGLTTIPMHVPDVDGRELVNGEDMSGDVLPGDPFLRVFDNTILVRAEYIGVFDKVKSVYDESCGSRLAVVTGQPGIGKTLWIHYALSRCLGQKQPVIWYRAKKFYFFSDNAHADSLPAMISDRLNCLFPIYVTSPKQEHWDKLHQQRLKELVIMNPWTRAELEKVAGLYCRELIDIFKRFDNAGPSARLCLEYSPADIDEFYVGREKDINFHTPQHMLKAILDKKGGLSLGDISRTLCVVHRSDSKDCRFIVEPISAFIRHRLLAQLWEWKEQDCVNMIEHFSRVQGAGGMRGLVVESLYQRQFIAKIQIEAKPIGLITVEDLARI